MQLKTETSPLESEVSSDGKLVRNFFFWKFSGKLFLGILRREEKILGISDEEN